MLHRHCHATAGSKFLGVDFRAQSVLISRIKKTVGLVDSEESLVAEDVDEISKTLASNGRNHLVDQ